MKKPQSGDSIVIQWLGLHASTAGQVQVLVQELRSCELRRAAKRSPSLQHGSLSHHPCQRSSLTRVCPHHAPGPQGPKNAPSTLSLPSLRWSPEKGPPRGCPSPALINSYRAFKI